MKTQRVQIYTVNQQYSNRCSPVKSNKCNNERPNTNIAFTANVSGLNRAVFEQRNIIKPNEKLDSFISGIIDKICEQGFNTNDEFVMLPKLGDCLGNRDFSSITYDDLLPLIHSLKDSVLNPKYVNSYKTSGMAYQKQALDAINKVRTKINEIIVSYGFNPKDLNLVDVSDKSSIYRRFDELFNDPSVKKESKDDCDILFLPDKDNTCTIELLRKYMYGNDLKGNQLYQITLSNILYKDSEISYESDAFKLCNYFAEITADDCHKLKFQFNMPKNPYFEQFYIPNKEINTLKLLEFTKFGRIDSQSTFYDIKDYTNSIIYTFNSENEADRLISVYDHKKGMLLVNRALSKDNIIEHVDDLKLALSTSLYTNLLQPKKPMGACVVLPYDIRKTQGAIKQELEPHILNGVGTGFNLSETEEPVKVLTSLNEILKGYDGKTQRPPAGIAILDVSHKDILSFINAKREADFNDWRFNISVSVPDDFMQKVADNETIKLTNGEEVPTKSIYDTIINSMHYCGEPGIVFKDRVEAANPVPNHKYKGMASCAEIGLENGEMCLFSHINLSKFLNKIKGQYGITACSINFEALGKAAEILSRALDNIIDINLAEKVGEDNIASQKRRFGIGVCGFADLLAEMGVRYGDDESQMILANCLEVINFHSKKASMELAKERGPFPLFKESRYNERDFLIKHLDDSSPIKQTQWNELYDNIQKYGLRNATTTALPPTGSSSRIVGASYSIEPYFDLRSTPLFYKKLDEYIASEQEKQLIIDEVNRTGNIIDRAYKYMPEIFRRCFLLAAEIPYKNQLAIVGTAQKFVDDGISKTINFENSATWDDIDEAVKMAYDLGLKGIAVFRDGCLTERK